MKVYRLLSIINLLVNNNKITILELANKLEVSKRTIYRDLDLLTMAGIPIISYSGYKGGISISKEFIIDKTFLSTNDVKNILLGLSSILSLDEDKEIKYLISRLMPKEMQNINEKSDIIIDLTNWYNNNFLQKMINSFRQAIANQQYIYIDYHSRSITTKRKIEPYKLIFKETSWYLYSYCLSRNDFRLFKLSRISSYQLSNNNFKFKREIKINELCHLPIEKKDNKVNAIKWEIILECNTNDKDFIIEKFSAENLTWENEKLILQFESNSLEDTTNLIISLQDKVKVIKPIELRNKVYQKIKRMYKIYEG